VMQLAHPQYVLPSCLASTHGQSNHISSPDPHLGTGAANWGHTPTLCTHSAQLCVENGNLASDM
jgi:hypothetical protein